MKNWKNGKARFHYNDGGKEFSYSVRVTESRPGFWQVEASISGSHAFAVYNVKAQNLLEAQGLVEAREIGGILRVH